MAFQKKTWKDRKAEYIGRRTLVDVLTNSEQTVDVRRAEGTIIEEGDNLNAGTFNDLENRIDTAFISADEKCTQTKKEIQAQIDEINANNAGAHNAIYRGKYLGTSVTAKQYAAIAAGTFEDLYIGDYWTTGGVNYRIAAFDYYFNTGVIGCTTHHVTIVPDVPIDSQKMNDSNTTVGGYLGSAMYTTNMTTAKNKITSAFGADHILNHTLYLDNTVTNGYTSARAWVNSTIELMTEQNVCGGKLYQSIACGTAFPNVTRIDKSQYPLFAMRPDLISNRKAYWLRDVAAGTNFAFIGGAGELSTFPTGNPLGVRPAFSIKS